MNHSPLVARIGLVVLAAAMGGACGGDGPSGPATPVKVVTWNLYLGTDLVPLALASSPAEVPAIAAEQWANVQDSDFPARARVLAARIAELDPDLVALQEVSLYRRQTPSDYTPGATPNATDVELDFLGLLMDELALRGSGLRVAEEALNADVEVPVSDGAGGLFDLRVTDRDVILAGPAVQTSAATQTKFSAAANITAGGAGGVPLSFVRSLSHVTVEVGDAGPFTFTNSHLEIGSLAAVQMAQANQLVEAVSAIPGPMILAGDFNSPPGQPSYVTLMMSFRDRAAALPPPNNAPTCCQDLADPSAQAGSRIDLVLTRGTASLTSAKVVGNDPTSDRTPSGRWPSDHLGVFAVVELRP